jgi:hypothetical protein
MRKCAKISPYMRRPLVTYDFATVPFWISLHMRKILFYFLSVYFDLAFAFFDNAWCRCTVKIVMSDSRHHSWNPGMSLIKLFWVGKASTLGGSRFRSGRGVPESLEIHQVFPSRKSLNSDITGLPAVDRDHSLIFLTVYQQSFMLLFMYIFPVFPCLKWDDIRGHPEVLPHPFPVLRSDNLRTKISRFS